MVNRAAQSSAPFEVLVSVVIMGFVLVMGYQAVTTFYEEQCKSQIRDTAQDLKAKITEAVSGNSVSLKFFPPQCFSDENKMFLKVITSRQICTSQCNESIEECLLFTYRSSDFSYDLCLDKVPTITNFLTSSGGCADLDGFSTVDFRNPDPAGDDDIIPRGIYNLQNRTGSAETVPKICAYRKIG